MEAQSVVIINISFINFSNLIFYYFIKILCLKLQTFSFTSSPLFLYSFLLPSCSPLHPPAHGEAVSCSVCQHDGRADGRGGDGIGGGG